MEELLISLSDAREMVGQSRFEDAAELYASALRTSQRAFGEDHAKTRDILVHLANARAALGQNEEAQELLERALQMIAGGDTVGDGSSEASPSLIQVASIRMSLASVYRASGEEEKAAELETAAMGQAQAAEQKRQEAEALRAVAELELRSRAVGEDSGGGEEGDGDEDDDDEDDDDEEEEEEEDGGGEAKDTGRAERGGEGKMGEGGEREEWDPQHAAAGNRKK